ncbi:TonB-dependent receptor [Empedobacter falsenii]
MKKTAICIALLSFLFRGNFVYAKSLEKIDLMYYQEIPISLILDKLGKENSTQIFYSVTDLQDIKVNEANIKYNELIPTLNYLKSNYPIDFEIKNNTVVIKRIAIPDIDNFNEEIDINEIVVVGYGKQNKKDISGSISSVNDKDLQGVASSNFGDMLAGKATGIQVTQSDAGPGSSPNIRIRGIGTLTAGSNPLIVVDGFPLSEGTNLNSIDPYSISSIDVLKDAASAAIYGSRGANGVILITTKKGKEGKLDISLDTYYGIQTRADNTQLVDAYDMATFLKEARDNNYLTKGSNRSVHDDTATRKSNGASLRELIPEYLIPYLNREQGLVNHNWLDTVFRDAEIKNVSLNVLGGNDKTKFSITGSYFNQDGIIIGSDYEKFSGNINITTSINDNLKIGANINPLYSKGNTIDSQSGGRTYNFVQMATTMYPFFAARDNEGNLLISEQIKNNTATDGALVENPLAVAEMTKRKNSTFKTFGNIFAELTFFKNFKYRLNIGGDYTSYEYNFFDPSNVGSYRAAAPDVTIAERVDYITKNYLVENLIFFDKRLGKHNFNAVLGQSFQNEYRNHVNIKATDFPDNSIQNIAGGTSFKTTVSQYEWVLISYFGRFNYDFGNRYNVMASIRRDGSSRFGKNSKWGDFHALSLGWTVSNEEFYPDNNIVNKLKIRYSYGSNGNNQIPNFGALSLMSQVNYVYGNVLAPGYSSNTAPNPNISWEKSISNNFGLDFSLFRNALQVTADYYFIDRKDLLLNVPVPQQSGYSNSLQNIGRIRNEGFELQLTTKNIHLAKDFSYIGNFNFSTNKNKVLALANGQDKIVTGTNNFSITKIGHSIGEMYGYNILGVYKSEAEINNSPHINGTLVGDYIMEDLNNDGKIDEDDKKSFGSGVPKYVLSLNNQFKYKNWQLDIMLYSELGKKVYNSDMVSTLESGEGFGMASQYYFDNRYNPEKNPNGFFAMPNMNYSNNRKEARTSSLFYKNGDYLRLRTLKVAYNLPQNILSKLNIKSIQLYFIGNNLFTWTDYKGLNIDATSNNVLTQGFDNGYYPVTKSYSFGMTMNF